MSRLRAGDTRAPAQADPVPASVFPEFSPTRVPLTSVFPEFFQRFTRKRGFKPVGGPESHARINLSLAQSRRRSERIFTTVAGSRVNRVSDRRLAKKQPMRWSRRGTHRRVQIRVAVLGRALAPSVSTRVPAL